MKKLKYAVILGDGMADRPIDSLNGATPLKYAKTPVWDMLAEKSVIGLANTTPDSMAPGSDVANLAVMGYDPEKYHTGRSPLEAASIGVPMLDHQTTFRCNLVNLSDEPEYDDKTMIDYSSDEIPTEESSQLIETLNEHFKNDVRSLYTGMSYRHILLYDHIEDNIRLTPPHDISTRKIRDYLPGNCEIYDMMRRSYDILMAHPVNKSRIERGLRPANSMWIWGQGKKTVLPSFYEKYGLKCSIISAVDLIRGIGRCAGMDIINVEGATGNIHTNFEGKAQAAVDALLGGSDMVYVHVEAPDESGHRFELDNKILSIEKLDMMTGHIFNSLQKNGYDMRIIVLPDHPTPLETRTHAREPIPFMIYDSRDEKHVPGASYDEFYAETTGVFIKHGYNIMDCFLEKMSL